MTKSIFLHIPIDIDVSKNYEIPTIENQKDTLIAALNSIPQEPETPQENNNANQGFGFGGGMRGAKKESKEDKAIKDQHAGWIDVMSYSHNVATGGRSQSRRKTFVESPASDGAIHIGELTCTKFVSVHTPSLNYLCLRREIIPHAILRVIGEITKDGDKQTMNIIEYELQYASLTNVSVSGGAGGKPVETMSLGAKVFNVKYIDLNIHTGEFDTYQVYQWDTLKGTGSKTLISQGSSSTKSLLEYAKKRLMIDLDSHDPSMVALIKELGLVTDYDLPVIKPSEYKFKVQVTNEPLTFKRVTVSTLTVDAVTKAIAEKLSIPAASINSIYNCQENVEVENDLDLENLIAVYVKVDGKFYGY